VRRVKEPSALLLASLTLGLSCHSCKADSVHPSPPPGVTAASLTVTSRSFASGGAIPVDLTCDGANRSPQLTWSAPPAGTKSFAVVAHDPDAQSGDFTHWVLFNVPGDALNLAEAVDTGALGATNGSNDFKQTGYGGPCPPKYEIHHYVFELYAVDTKIGVPAGASREAVETALSGHVLGEGSLVGTFSH
jgi:Raf kinase inhibitor-like YbhB/YbcL family protein